MISWKIYQDKDISWKYRIDYNDSPRITQMSGGSMWNPLSCYEEMPIEKRRVKYLQEKLLDTIIHLEVLTKRFESVAARELLDL